MNFYNPYNYLNPYTSGLGAASKTGILNGISGLGKNLSFGSIVNGTGRTLNLINQALPIIKQARPMFSNAKTMFKVMNEFKKVDAPINKDVPKTNNHNINQNNTKQNKKIEEKKVVISNQNVPTFFL